jgi:hypothetical protein
VTARHQRIGLWSEECKPEETGVCALWRGGHVGVVAPGPSPVAEHGRSSEPEHGLLQPIVPATESERPRAREQPRDSERPTFAPPACSPAVAEALVARTDAANEACEGLRALSPGELRDLYVNRVAEHERGAARSTTEELSLSDAEAMRDAARELRDEVKLAVEVEELKRRRKKP